MSAFCHCTRLLYSVLSDWLALFIVVCLLKLIHFYKPLSRYMNQEVTKFSDRNINSWHVCEVLLSIWCQLSILFTVFTGMEKYQNKQTKLGHFFFGSQFKSTIQSILLRKTQQQKSNMGAHNPLQVKKHRNICEAVCFSFLFCASHGMVLPYWEWVSLLYLYLLEIPLCFH